MANLKGSTFEKQVKDIHHRLSAFGESRHQKNDHLTHGTALSQLREQHTKGFAEFCSNKGLSGKLNEHMTNDNIREYIKEYSENKALVTQEKAISAISSLVQGLEEKNIDMPINKEVFRELTAEVKEIPPPPIETGRSIDNVDTKIEQIYDNRFESAVIAECQRELGLRVSEAHELVNNHERYINNGEVEGLVGKGNHTYDNKEISPELQAKIEQCENIPSLSTYFRDLKEIGIDKSHDLKYTFVKENMNELSRKELSKELNHKREEMTDRYIVRL